MAVRPLANQRFDGGWAIGKKIGIPYSFAYSQSIDFRQTPSQFSLLGAPRREDNNIVKDLVVNEVMDKSGNIYAIGEQGFFYKRGTNHNWSLIGNTPPSGFGMVYDSAQDSIYIANHNSVSLFNPVSNNPALTPNFYADSVSTYNNSMEATFNVNANQTGSTLTTAILIGFNESQVESRFFQTDISPMDKLTLNINAKGTGNWTVIVHDGLNNELGRTTVANANLVNKAINNFVFTNPIDLTVAPEAQTYHIHVTSTVGDGTVFSTVSNDLSSCDFQLYANRLIVTKNGLHPMAIFQQFVVIGNGRYLSVWEPLGDPAPDNTEWLRHDLQFPPEFEVCGLAVTSEYLAIACENSTIGNEDAQGGYIFFWDGLSTSYNFFAPIPEGSPYGLDTYENMLYYEAGGAWYTLQPLSDAVPQKIRLLPGGDNSYGVSNNNTVVYPYASTVRNGIKLMAWPSISTNTTIPYGIYSYGRTDINLSNSFGYSYVISPGSQTYDNTNNLTIGMIQNFGDTLHISWRDDENGGYGLDVVDSNSPLPPFATWESPIFDNGYVGKQKLALYMDATWVTPLPDGVDIVLKYAINRGDWIYSERFNVNQTWLNGDGYARFSIAPVLGAMARFNEIEVGLDIYSASNTFITPVVSSITLIYDDMVEELLQ